MRTVISQYGTILRLDDVLDVHAENGVIVVVRKNGTTYYVNGGLVQVEGKPPRKKKANEKKE